MLLGQAEFATSAVDFLHRVGRTGRAGRPGRVTSLVGEGSRELAETIRAAVEDRQSTVSDPESGFLTWPC